MNLPVFTINIYMMFSHFLLIFPSDYYCSFYYLNCLLCILEFSFIPINLFCSPPVFNFYSFY